MARLSVFENKILKIFKENSEPLSPSEVLDECLKFQKKPHKVTVYRNIKSLLDKGIIIEGGFKKGSQSYQLNVFHSHYFFCKKCDKKYPIPDNLANQIEKILIFTQEKMDQKFSLKNTRHILQFSTFCNSCI